MCKKSFRRCIENSLMCNVFQQLITSFCVVRKKHTLQCHCQLRSSRTSENCYEHFFFVTDPIQRYQSAFSQGCKAIQSHSKLQEYFYGLIVLFGWFVWYFFTKQSLVLCTQKTSFRKNTMWALFNMFYVFCLFRTLSLEFLGMLNKIIACKLAFLHVYGNRTKP